MMAKVLLLEISSLKSAMNPTDGLLY